MQLMMFPRLVIKNRPTHAAKKQNIIIDTTNDTLARGLLLNLFMEMETSKEKKKKKKKQEEKNTKKRAHRGALPLEGNKSYDEDE